jgi:hypothetical protein
MNIYSIKEILKATNNFLDPNNKSEIKKNIKISKKKKLPNNKNIIRKKEKTHISEKINNKNTKIPLVLENEIPASNTINLYNYKIKIKPEVRDHMINELFIYLKKKIKKNTLKLIIEEQLEKKNLINKINFLKQKENQLKIDYLALKNIYELTLENNKILKIDNNNLRNNLDQASITKEQLDIENKKLRINLKEQEANLEVSLEKNKSFEINNSELKNTISRYIVNYKKLQEKVTLLGNSKNLELEDEIKKVKFYQDENIRLSSELLLVRKKNETIKVNLNDIELEKQKISNKIKELSNTITGKSNVISPNIIKEIPGEAQKDIKKLNDKEHKNLDEVINRIFNKI